MRMTSVWWLSPPWGLALIAVVLGAIEDRPIRDQALAVVAAFLLACTARIVRSQRALAGIAMLSACGCGALAVTQSLATIPAGELWWLVAVLPTLVLLGIADVGTVRCVAPAVTLLAAVAATWTGAQALAAVLGVFALVFAPTAGLTVLRKRSIFVPDADVHLAAWAQASVIAGGVALTVLLVSTPEPGGGTQTVQAWASATFALVLVAVYSPLVTLNSRGDGHGRVDPATTMIAVARQVGADPSGGPEALDRICDALRRGWDVAHVAILRDGGSTVAERSSSELTVALWSDERTVGHLIVRVHEGRDVEQVLPHIDRIRSLLAASLAVTDLNRGTEQMRLRVKGARDAERRAMTRELRKLVVPAVRGIASELRDAAESLDRDPRLIPELDDTARRLTRSTADVRRIAHAMLPGALDDGDLGAAIDELLGQPWVSHRGVLRADGAEQLDRATQRTLYLVLSDLLDELRILGLDAGVDVTLVVDEHSARVRVGMPGRSLSQATRERLREATERHASQLVLTIRRLPDDEGVEVVVRR
ncbi:hypothetical protein GCM10009795_005240 [Nocardioides hankookensis]|uniref:Uncharacterized protein n=1 Tax=Nocardioides hankookensis TaxID=443157 RepID=A0ABW1LLJ4_9ACTN